MYSTPNLQALSAAPWPAIYALIGEKKLFQGEEGLVRYKETLQLRSDPLDAMLEHTAKLLRASTIRPQPSRGLAASEVAAMAMRTRVTLIGDVVRASSVHYGGACASTAVEAALAGASDAAIMNVLESSDATSPSTPKRAPNGLHLVPRLRVLLRAARRSKAKVRDAAADPSTAFIPSSWRDATDGADDDDDDNDDEGANEPGRDARSTMARYPGDSHANNGEDFFGGTALSGASSLAGTPSLGTPSLSTPSHGAPLEGNVFPSVKHGNNHFVCPHCGSSFEGVGTSCREGVASGATQSQRRNSAMLMTAQGGKLAAQALSIPPASLHNDGDGEKQSVSSHRSDNEATGGKSVSQVDDQKNVSDDAAKDEAERVARPMGKELLGASVAASASATPAASVATAGPGEGTANDDNNGSEVGHASKAQHFGGQIHMNAVVKLVDIKSKMHHKIDTRKKAAAQAVKLAPQEWLDYLALDGGVGGGFSGGSKRGLKKKLSSAAASAGSSGQQSQHVEDMLSKVGKSVPVMSISRVLDKHIYDTYTDKAKAEHDDTTDATETMANFLCSFFFRKFGEKRLVQDRLVALLSTLSAAHPPTGADKDGGTTSEPPDRLATCSLDGAPEGGPRAWDTSDAWAYIFARFCGMHHPLPAEQLNWFLGLVYETQIHAHVLAPSKDSKDTIGRFCLKEAVRFVGTLSKRDGGAPSSSRTLMEHDSSPLLAQLEMAATDGTEADAANPDISMTTSMRFVSLRAFLLLTLENELQHLDQVNSALKRMQHVKPAQKRRIGDKHRDTIFFGGGSVAGAATSLARLGIAEDTVGGSTDTESEKDSAD